MLTSSQTFHQPSLFETDLLLQLDATDPLLQLAAKIPWGEFDDAFSVHYTKGIGAPSKPIRLMVGLLILKQLEDLSDETVVLQWKRNPYYQAFCGMKEFQRALPCHSTELVHFRNRIGVEGHFFAVFPCKKCANCSHLMMITSIHRNYFTCVAEKFN